MGEAIANIQQNQQQENENRNYLFQKLNFDPPFWTIAATPSLGEEDSPFILGKFSFSSILFIFLLFNYFQVYSIY